MKTPFPRLHDIRSLLSELANPRGPETRQSNPAHRARVAALAARAEALGVTGHVSRALLRRLRREGKTIFAEVER